MLKIARLIAKTSFWKSPPPSSTAYPKLKLCRRISEIPKLFSYFGFLLAERMTRFNPTGIRLRATEIGDDFIAFTYGTIKKTQNIWLLRPAFDPEAMAGISERFHFETGITPALLF